MHLLALLIALWAHAPAARDSARWSTVSVGDDHACALDTAGRAFCWGFNHGGQLGGRAASPRSPTCRSSASASFAWTAAPTA